MKKYLFLTAALTVIFWTVIQNPAWARKNVKIATIGVVPLPRDRSLTYEQEVERVMKHLEQQIAQVLPDKPDLIVLPEACDRPSGMNNEERFEYYKTRGNRFHEFFAKIARENRCFIAFGIKKPDGQGIWRNTCFIMDRKGQIAGAFHKNYPTPDEMEGGIVASDKAPVFHTEIGDIGCAICFDLNFDELREKYAVQNPDLIIFPSMYHGGLVQAQWAYSCQAYFVASVGIRSLMSEIRNPMGEVVATTTNYFNFVVTTVNLDYQMAHLDDNWGKLKALKDKYGDEVIIHDPGEIGVVMITSESDKVTAEEMVKEFDIELVRDYFARTRDMRKDSRYLK